MIVGTRPAPSNRGRSRAAGIRPTGPRVPRSSANDSESWQDPRMEPLALVPPPVQVLPGTAAIGATGASLQEFWAWALSDLRTNTARSRLAEYLVAVALNVHHQPRVEWDSHDVTAPD